MPQEFSEYRLLSWRQSHENPNIDLVVSIQPKESNESRKFKVIASGDVLEVFLNDTQILSWVLFDTVLDEAEWETKSEELHISLTKTDVEPWKSALRNPVVSSSNSSESVMLSDEVLNAILGTETCSYAKFAVNESEETPDPDAILDDVLTAAPDAAESFEKNHHDSLRMEINAIRQELETEDIENREILEKVVEYDEKILATRCAEVTIANILDATTLDLIRLKLQSGDDVEDEDEPFADADEESLSATELFGSGLMALDRQDGTEGLHFLRLAALKHDHAQSVLNLVRIYMESRMEAKALQILLQSARRSVDPLINFTTAQMFDNGVNGLQPLFSLALHFYQRAASQGETTAMCFASVLHLRGACTAADGRHKVSNKQRAGQWMQCALDRGSIFAYKLLLEQHLMASNVAPHAMVELLVENSEIQPNYSEAKKYYQLLSDTSREMLKQIPQVEKRLNDLQEPEVVQEIQEEPAVPRVTKPVAPPATAPSQPTGVVAKPRHTKLERISRGSREGMSEKASRNKQPSPFGREACEQWAIYSAIAGSVWVLAFPLRVVAIPYVFKTIDDIVSVFV